MLEQYGDFITIKEAAPLLHVSEWLVRYLCNQGELPSVRVGRRILIPKVQLITHIEENMTGKAL